LLSSITSTVAVDSGTGPLPKFNTVNPTDGGIDVVTEEGR
jgi:hypothetical protein